MLEENAQSIAISALQHLAGDTELLSQFFGLTGMGIDELRASAGSTEFQVGLLDFFLQNEPALLALSASIDVSPQDIQKARFALQPPLEAEAW